MSMAWVRENYGVPAKRGMRVRVYFRPAGYGRLSPNDPGRWVLACEGKITSASHYLHVDGLPFHPTDGVVYLGEDGDVLLDTREG